MSKIKIFSLGGLNENGKNMYVVNVDGDIFVFDALIKSEECLSIISLILPPCLCGGFSYPKKSFFHNFLFNFRKTFFPVYLLQKLHYIGQLVCLQEL